MIVPGLGVSGMTVPGLGVSGMIVPGLGSVHSPNCGAKSGLANRFVAPLYVLYPGCTKKKELMASQ